MAVFRADDSRSSSSDEDPQNKEAEFLELEEFPVDLYEDETEKLNQQRGRFDQAPLVQPVFAPDKKETSALNGLKAAKPKSLNPKSSKGMLPKIKKPVALGLSALIVPSLVALAVFLLFQQLGMTLEHIERVSTGVRFGSLHLALSRRFNHVRREYVRTALYQETAGNQFARYSRTTLGHRLLNITPDKIYRHLNESGYKFRYSTFKGGAPLTWGRYTLTGVQYPGDPDERWRQIRNSDDALKFMRDTGASFNDSDLSRFRATPASFLLAKQIGVPFLRFRVIIDGLRSGSFKNTIRGSPGYVSQLIDQELLDGKQRLAQKLPRLKRVVQKFSNRDVVEQTRQNLAEKKLFPADVTQSLREAFDGRQQAFVAASAGSIAVSLITFACVLREIGAMIRDAFKMKIRGLQDNAIALTTVNSQIRAGDMSGEIVSDFSQRFNGFNTSANYQVGIANQDAANYLNKKDSDFSHEFGADVVFGGWAIEGLFQFSNLLNPVNFVQAAQNFISSSVSEFWANVFSQVAQFVGAGAKLTAEILEVQFRTACQLALNNAVQISILVAEVLGTILLTIFSGGVAGGAKLGAGQAIKSVSSALGGKFLVASIAGGVALDILLFDYLLPNMLRSSVGAETALLLDPDNLANGARNYASVDYGMHYLKEAEALNFAGSRIPVEQAVAETQSYLAWDRNREAQKGWINQLFALDNPYSAVSQLVAQQNPSNSWGKQSRIYLASLWSNLKTSFAFFQPVQATSSSSDLAQLLYPGQNLVIGFDEQIVSGQNQAFQHVNNTLYVEDNFEDLYEKYSRCLNLDVAEFLLTQSGVLEDEYGRSYYPEKCDSAEAQHYKMYYQDCLLIDSLHLQDSGQSSLLSNACYHLLPAESQADLVASLPDNQLSATTNNQATKLTSFSQKPPPIDSSIASIDQKVFNSISLLLSWRWIV